MSKKIKIDPTLRVYENALKSYKSIISKNPDSQLKGLVINIEYFINNIIRKNG